MKNQGFAEKWQSSFFTRKLFQRAVITMMIAELSNTVSAVVDSIITGRFLGETDLAAAGLGAPYYSIVAFIGGIMLVGCANMCTRAMGKGDREELSGVFSLIIGSCLALSLLLSVTGLCFTEWYVTIFGGGGARPEVFQTTVSYMKGLFPGAPAFIFTLALIPILQLDGDLTRPKLAALVSAVVDIVVDLLNVFVFKGGMLGMGIASSLGLYAGLFVLLSHFFMEESAFHFSFRKIIPSRFPELVWSGLPQGVSMICRFACAVVLNALLIRLAGDSAISAFTAQTNTKFVFATLGVGISQSVLLTGGIMVAEQDIREVKNVLWTALTDILTGVLGLGILLALTAGMVAVIFIPQASDAQSMAVVALRCVGIALPFLAFNSSTASYLQISSHKLLANIINIAIEFVCYAGLALILSPAFGVNGVWYSFPAGQALLSLIIVITFVLAGSKRQGQENHLALPKDFGVPRDDRMDTTICNREEITSFSEKVRSFCLNRGIKKSISYRLALCVEELAVNVLEHGFNDGKPHHLDIRVMIKDQKIILRLRDDCTKFDFRQATENWQQDPEHPEKNIGIRMVMAAADDISYNNSLDVNNLMITIANQV